ncbi:uncharacterized protein STEHIDRAFT_157247 [Stereum hirsutum FP-91666 SS1]|uniref:uncharacterized protein n=1 Tax=Stereum hirsutum (strain FP-91666) TaxID=721885 RepID=UPI0004449384|nr:uncharacterized protein STEHIDRAFT_157247 [Stereum hirsutum FP-91666 SS1]EIM86960.1 hypothetical protein STEHIDRAFT_157247 [Stereum hirsutum FP-91666 SS1]
MVPTGPSLSAPSGATQKKAHQSYVVQKEAAKDSLEFTMRVEKIKELLAREIDTAVQDFNKDPDKVTKQIHSGSWKKMTREPSIFNAVVPCLGKEEEDIYPGDIAMVRMSNGIEVMIGQYSLMFGKLIYGATLVKMVLH